MNRLRSGMRVASMPDMLNVMSRGPSMKRPLLYASLLLAVLAACGQKDNVTPSTQPSAPGTSPQPQPPSGNLQVSPSGGNAVSAGKSPVTPGGAPAPGEGKNPDNAGSAGSAPGK